MRERNYITKEEWQKDQVDYEEEKASESERYIQKVKNDGRMVANYLIEKANNFFGVGVPFFGTWVEKMCRTEGEERFALPNIRKTLQEKNMGGKIEQNIINILQEGGFA